MGLFDSIKKFKKELDKVESTVYSGKQSLIELYELNKQLEAEIALRTKELDTANKQMLTLQHIWDMMNSSKPLSSVLNAIVSSLQGELGYLYSCIAKKITDKDENYLQMLACSGKMFCDIFKNDFNCEPCDMKFRADDIKELSGKVRDMIIVTDEYERDGEGYDDPTRFYVRTLSRTNELIKPFCDEVRDLT